MEQLIMTLCWRDKTWTVWSGSTYTYCTVFILNTSIVIYMELSKISVGNVFSQAALTLPLLCIRTFSCFDFQWGGLWKSTKLCSPFSSLLPSNYERKEKNMFTMLSHSPFLSPFPSASWQLIINPSQPGGRASQGCRFSPTKIVLSLKKKKNPQLPWGWRRGKRRKNREGKDEQE